MTVKLNSGVVYKGKPCRVCCDGFLKELPSTVPLIPHSFFHTTGELQSVDGYMNIALEGTREFVDGKMRRSYGDAFVRGNNGMFFSNRALSIPHTGSLPRGVSTLSYSSMSRLVSRGNCYNTLEWLADFFTNQQ